MDKKQRFRVTKDSAVLLPEYGITQKEFNEKLVVHPVYNLPTATLSLSAGTEVECGTALTSAHKFTVGFVSNDSGGFVKPFKVAHSGTEKGSTDSGLVVSGNDLQMLNPFSVTVTDGVLTFTSKVPYSAAPVKKNNINIDDATGKFAAGTLTPSCSVTGRRKIFGIVANDTSNTAAPTSAKIRAAWTKATPWSTVGSVDLAYTAGAKVIGIAVPSTRKISAVSQITAVGTDPSWLDNFVRTSGIKVEGAGGYASVDYDLYIYTHPTNFGGSGTFRFTVTNA